MPTKDGPAGFRQDVTLSADEATLRAILSVPDEPIGIALFAHGSGSGRLSPRNTSVARALEQGRIATLLLDLLDESEEGDPDTIFDIDLLADRLLVAAHWTRRHGAIRALPIGYFGASTGSAAALEAAAREPSLVSAIVSRGGRPDLATHFLPRVLAPTLLIVGGDDLRVIQMNRAAYDLLRCEKELVIVPGATHLFEEPGTLERAADLARQWFRERLAAGTGSRGDHERLRRQPPGARRA